MSLAVAPRAAVTPERGARAARRATPDDRRPAVDSAPATAGQRREARARRAVISADRAAAQAQRHGSMAHARARRRRQLAGPERRRTSGTVVRTDGTDDGPGGLRPRRWMATRQHRRLPRRMCVPLENKWTQSAFARLPARLASAVPGCVR